jgi:hypothetical protein
MLLGDLIEGGTTPKPANPMVSQWLKPLIEGLGKTATQIQRSLVLTRRSFFKASEISALVVGVDGRQPIAVGEPRKYRRDARNAACRNRWPLLAQISADLLEMQRQSYFARWMVRDVSLYARSSFWLRSNQSS